ncbi:MAG: CopG family transcriptional regulator [Proteobacteria bacterium]|nr:CopG family transcriptional regulator [Pseudomonadota bacterium]
MRTTLTLDDDILHAARSLAARQGASLGEMVSQLARRGLQRETNPAATRNGVPLLVRQDPSTTPITLELVNALRDE